MNCHHDSLYLVFIRHYITKTNSSVNQVYQRDHNTYFTWYLKPEELYQEIELKVCPQLKTNHS